MIVVVVVAGVLFAADSEKLVRVDFLLAVQLFDCNELEDACLATRRDDLAEVWTTMKLL